MRIAARAAIAVLLAAVACSSPGVGPVVVAPPPAPVATPGPTPSTERWEMPRAEESPQRPPAPTAPPQSVAPAEELEGPLVRILLRRTDDMVTLVQPGRAYLATWANGSEWLWGPLTLQAGGGTAWQVGAWSDPGSAEAVRRELSSALSDGASVTLSTTESGLHRVRVQWPHSEHDDGAERLARHGYSDAFKVPVEGGVRLGGAGGRAVETDTEVLLEPAGQWPVAIGSRTYRGRLRARGSGGQLLLINELNMEAYLKGVVPVEMGPAVFPQLEALKAQAVAARTYAVAHLGDHEDEGYDLCATPACQAYHGAGVEHRLSSRAVDETAGLVAVWHGAPIDAMYTSTCGGHTEDASSLFEGRDSPYLKGVPCAWERELVVTGTGEDGGWRERAAVEAEIARAAIGPSLQGGELQALVDRVAAMCGGEAPALGFEAGVEAFSGAVLSAAGLDSAAVVLARAEGDIQRLLALTDLVEVDLPPPTGDWRKGWHLRAAAAALEVQGVIQRDRGEAVPHPDGVAIYPRRAEASESLHGGFVLYERWADRCREVSMARVLPGTTLERVRLGEEDLAVVVVRSHGGGEADRRSSWRSWVREKTWQELAGSLGVTDLERLEITRRTPSGRVVGLAAFARSGARKEWQGFAVRRALGLPETLFAMHRMRREDGVEIVRFIGRGWGHGVGLCQNGSYGLARAGRGFEEILKTYYSGVSIVEWKPSIAHHGSASSGLVTMSGSGERGGRSGL